MKQKLGTHLIWAGILCKASLSRRLKEKGFDVTAEQWKCLNCLYLHGELKQFEIADMMIKPAPALSKIITRLKKLNLVAEKTGKDKRERILRLTSKANSIIDEMNMIAHENEKKMFSGVTKEEREVLLKVLKKLRVNLEY